MPSHPDRVRRSYHEIKVNEIKHPETLEHSVTIKVSRLQLATAMSRREVEHNIFRAIKNGIFERFRD